MKDEKRFENGIANQIPCDPSPNGVESSGADAHAFVVRYRDERLISTSTSTTGATGQFFPFHATPCIDPELLLPDAGPWRNDRTAGR